MKLTLIGRPVSKSAQRRKPSTDDSGTQLLLPLNLPIIIEAERPKKPVKPRGLKPTNVLSPRCLQFVFYLECDGRRCYQCRCGSALLGSRHRLNYRDPSPADWQSAPEGIIYPSGNGLHVRMNQTTRRTEVCWEKSAPNKNSDSLSALASDA